MKYEILTDIEKLLLAAILSDDRHTLETERHSHPPPVRKHLQLQVCATYQ
jgi:hypothetical protein